jgi:hypothetical protein
VASQRRVEGCSHLSDGENGEWGGSLGQLTIFIAGGERELWGRPLESLSSWTGEPSAGARFPYSWVTDRWASVGFSRLARARSGMGRTVPRSSLLRIGFSIFLN